MRKSIHLQRWATADIIPDNGKPSDSVVFYLDLSKFLALSPLPLYSLCRSRPFPFSFQTSLLVGRAINVSFSLFQTPPPFSPTFLPPFWHLSLLPRSPPPFPPTPDSTGRRFTKAEEYGKNGKKECLKYFYFSRSESKNLPLKGETGGAPLSRIPIPSRRRRPTTQRRPAPPPPSIRRGRKERPF